MTGVTRGGGFRGGVVETDCSIPRVALEALHRVHLEEIERVKVLNAELSAWRAGYSNSHVAVDVALRALLIHMRAHFADEEARMRASAFPSYPLHRADHARALATAAAVEDVWLSERDHMPLWTYVDSILPAWTLQHIQEMDIVMAQYLVNHQQLRHSREALSVK